MSIYIKSGSALPYLQSILNGQTTSYQKSLEQLSSGNKYTSVGDNPIEVCESAKLQVRINSNKQASDNVSIGKDMLSSTENYQDIMLSNIQRIRDLTVQAASETYTATDKDAILSEIKARLNFIDSTSTSANFDGVKLMDGSSSATFLQIGSNSDATMPIGDALIDTHANALGIDLPGVTGATWTTADIQTYIGNLDTATDTLLAAGAKIGGYLNRLDTASQTLTKMNENLIENKSVISDTDTAKACADLVRYQILQQGSASILVQANQAASWALQLLNNK